MTGGAATCATGLYRDRGSGGVAMVARAPVGVYFHFDKIPIDAVVEGGWSPYVYRWDPYHGDVSAKIRYYFR